jgi:hypothetical protein
VSSEEEMHMLPSFCEGIPSDMSPSEWFGVISVIASGIITRDWRLGFKRRKEDVEAFSGDGVQMEKRRCCGIFWRTGFILAIASNRQATGVQIGRLGFIILAKKKGEWGSNAKIRGSFAQRENFGVQENEIKNRENFGVQEKKQKKKKKE